MPRKQSFMCEQKRTQKDHERIVWTWRVSLAWQLIWTNSCCLGRTVVLSLQWSLSGMRIPESINPGQMRTPRVSFHNLTWHAGKPRTDGQSLPHNKTGRPFGTGSHRSRHRMIPVVSVHPVHSGHPQPALPSVRTKREAQGRVQSHAKGSWDLGKYLLCLFWARKIASCWCISV